MSASERVTVVGAGVVGAALTWWLVQQGADVLLLDSVGAAGGASGGPGKRGVRASGRDLADLPLMAPALELWDELAERIGADTGYERIGSLRLYEEAVTGISGGWVSASARAAVQRGFGIATELLSTADVLERDPAIRSDVLGALHVPADGVIDHTATTTGLVRAAATLGAEVRRARITALRLARGRVVALGTEDGDIPVPGPLVLAANADVPALLEAATGRALPVWTMRPQMIFASTPEPVALRSLVGHDARRISLKRVADGRIMISGGWPGSTTAIGLTRSQLESYAGANVDQAVAVLPALADAVAFDLDATRVETMSLDGQPLVGSLQGIDDLAIATGWTGHGFAISIEMTRLLADALLTGRWPSLLAPFAPSRFPASA